jgi:anti-sigma regulatory factor (Ser/Thr protein kinase)
MNDVMNALEKGHMDDNVTRWMTREVQVLHEEMPLSFAIAAFNKYPFRGFPVEDRDNRLTGMLTFRNINLALIRELSRQLNRMEHLIEDSEHPEIFDLVKVYSLQQHDFENGGKASTEIKQFLKRRKLPSGIIRRVAVACYELEINLVAHSLGGMLGIDINARRIRISANDLGPGIESIELALTEGFSTASEWVRSMGFGAGMGLPNVKKISDEFEIHSEPGLGTMILSIIYLNNEEDRNHESL